MEWWIGAVWWLDIKFFFCFFFAPFLWVVFPIMVDMLMGCAKFCVFFGGFLFSLLKFWGNPDGCLLGLLSWNLLLVLCFQCIKIEACTSCGISCLKFFYFLFFACVCFFFCFWLLCWFRYCFYFRWADK